MAGAHLHPGDVGTLHVHLGGGGDDVGLVHAAERHAVHLVGARHKEEAGGELAEAHHAATLEAAGEEDEHGARSDGGPQLGGVLLAGGAAEGTGRL